MRRPISLALRLVLCFALITMVWLLAIGWFTEGSLKGHFDEEDLSELQIIADHVEKILLDSQVGHDSFWRERRLKDVLVGHHHATLHVQDEVGLTVFASANGPDLLSLVASRPKGHLIRVHHGDHIYRLLSRRVASHGTVKGLSYAVLIAVSFDYHERFLEHFSRTLWLVIAVGVVFVGLMAWLIVWQGLAPLHRIIDRIRHISVNQLQTRLEPRDVPKELEDLATSFNGMIERLDEAFQRVSNFSADIAHELRTPVTSLMTQTQVALSRARSVDEYREVLYSNMEEFERMSQMINDMLFLAQSDTGLQPAALVSVDLLNELHSLFDFYEAWAEDYGVKLILNGSGFVKGEPLMLRRALSNLMSNAIRHTPRGGQVEVAIYRASPDLPTTVAIANTGTPIPHDRLPRIFDRFFHVKSALHGQASGTGLGLAIVKSIVDAHHGTIAVTSSAGVTTFRVSLPSEKRA